MTSARRLPEISRIDDPARIALLAERAGPTIITSLPEVVHLEIYQGDAFYLTLNVLTETGAPFSLTGASPKAQVRSGPADRAEVMAEFTATVSGNVLSLTLPSAQAELLMPGENVWDCQITVAGAVTTLCAGSATVTAEVTR